MKYYYFSFATNNGDSGHRTICSESNFFPFLDAQQALKKEGINSEEFICTFEISEQDFLKKKILDYIRKGNIPTTPGLLLSKVTDWDKEQKHTMTASCTKTGITVKFEKEIELGFYSIDFEIDLSEL